MKTTLLFAAALAGGCGILFGLAEKDKNGALAPKLSIDTTPPQRSGHYGGFSKIVDKVSPSVVGVFTTREASPMELSMGGLRGAPELFESPMFRDLFRDRGIPIPSPERRAPRSLPKQRGLGSGVILSADGYVLTNNHVVERASDIQVQLYDGKEYGAEIVATDPASDLAVIKVDAKKLPAATLGDSEQLRPGDFVLAIGSPFGLSHTVTHGIVSAIGRDNLNITGYEDFIQTDASINPGNSGGALIDNKGRVVGINTAIYSRGGGNVGIGFAIPINMAVEIAEELITDGEIKRGYLGVNLGRLDKRLADALGVEAEGVLVNDVMPDTPAEKAGFEAGDVIVAVDGEKVDDVADVRRMVGRQKPGARVEFDVRRGGKDMSLEARIAEMPSDLLAGSPVTPSPSPAEKGALEGVQLGALDATARGQLGIGDDVDGVVVIDVEPDADAAEAGLRPGDVITEINRKEVSSPREAYAEAKAEDGKPALLRVTDGKTKRFVAIG